MSKKTILKFNFKSIRPATCLALAILVVGAFGSSVQAQWVNENFSTLAAGVAPTATLPLSKNGDGFALGVSPSGGALQISASLPASGSETRWTLSDSTFSTPRTSGYIAFKILQNVNAGVGTSNYMNFRLGPADSSSLGTSANNWLELRFVQAASSNLKISCAGGTTLSTTTISSTAQVAIQIWYNQSGSAINYTRPDTGVSTSLATGTFAVFANNVAMLAPGTFPANIEGALAVTTAVGKMAFIIGSTQKADFTVDDIYAAATPPSSGVAITSAATATAQAGYPFSYTITSSGVTSPSYAASPLPSGLSVNSSTGVISGTLATTATSTTVGLTATGTGGPATANLALTITAPPAAAPAITSAATASGFLTKAFTYQITTGTTSPSSTPTAYAIATGTLPSGLTLNTATGAITGTPTGSSGVTVVTYTATNPAGTSAEQTLTITINPAPLFTWNNTGSVWTTGSSWTNGVAPANSTVTDTAAFGNLGGSATGVNVGIGQSIGGIVFNSGAYAYTWTGTDIKVGYVGSITNNSAATQTFGNKVINDGGTGTWSSVSGGAMVFNGGIDLTSSATTRALIFAGAGNATVNSVIANGGTATSGTVTVTGTGATILSGNNTYSGLTTMNAAGGTLTLSGNNSGAAGGVTLTAGTLNINNNNALGLGPITFATGTTINNTSASAVVNAGNQAWTWTDLLTFGASTNTAANNLNLGAGTATVSSSRTITLAGTGTKLTMGPVNITSASTGRTLTGNGAGNTLEMGGLTLSANTSNAVVVDLLGSANLNVTGPIVNGSAFAHGVNVGATGTNTFSGANTYTGTTKVSGNTLILSGTSASSGYILAGATTNVVLKVNAVNALNSSATLLGSSSSSTAGTLEFAAAGDYALNQYLGQNMNFSNSSGSAATLTFTNASNILGTATSGKTFANKSTNLTITFNGEVDISGAENATNTISTLGPVVISNRVFNSNTSFTRSLLKLETNSLTMYGVNSYNGTTIVSRGTLSIPTGGSLTACGDTIVKGTGTTSGNSASLNLAGAAGVVQVSTNGFVRGGGAITTLQVQEAGAVEVALGSTWNTGGTIDFATGSKVSVIGTPITGNTYTLMTASADITGSPILVGATGWALRVDGANLLLEEIDIYNIPQGGSTTFSEIISGTAPLVKKGLGTAIITGDNTYTGGTVLQAGTLQVGHANGLGTGVVTLTSGTLKSTVDLDLGRLGAGTTSTVGSSNQTYLDTYGTLTLLKYTGNSTTINGAVTLDVANATTMTMGTLLGNSSADSLVTKIGAGTVKLMGGSTKLSDAALSANGNGSTVLGGWRIQEGTVWFAPSSNNGGGNGPITLAGGNAKFSKLQNSNGTYTGFEVPSDVTVENDGLIQYDPSPLTLLGQNNLGFKNLSIGARKLQVATDTTSTVVGQGLPIVNFKSATLSGSATLENPTNLDLVLQAVSGTGGFTKTGSGTLYLSDQPNQAAAFATVKSASATAPTIESINVEYAGSGYTVAPAVTLMGGGATIQATATATIDAKGRVTSIALNTAGSGYTSLPQVVIEAPPTVATANSYTGGTTVEQGKLNLSGSYASSVTVKSGAALQLDWLAPAEAKCSIDAISSGTTGYLANTANAYVKDLYLTKSVKGYTPNTILNLTIAAPVKVDGTGPVSGGVAATATATVNADGVISALNIVNPGSGYVILPMVTIPAPTVPTVVATTTGSITFESGAKLALNIVSPTSASYTLVTANGGISGNPTLEPAISGYALKKSTDGKSLILEVVKTTPVIAVTPGIYTYTGSIQGPGVNEVNKGGSTGGVTLSYAGTGSTTYGPSATPPTNAGTYTLTATVASDSFYNGASSTPTAFTIAKANSTVSVAPTASAVTVGAQLSSSNLSGGTASVAGTYAWTTPSTVVSSSSSYPVTFNPIDGTNYNTALTSASVTANPAGTTYSGWLSGNGGTASDTAFLNYVFGAATAGTLDASLKPTVAVSGGNLVLTYNVRQGTVGLTVTAQTSADLATGAAGWGTSGVTDVAVGTPRTVNGVSVQQRTASVSVSGGKKFLRIQALQAAP